MTNAKKQTFSRVFRLLAVLMLMLARASASLAAVPQASSGAQEPGAVEPASDSVVPRVIQYSGIVKDAEGKPATGPVQLTFSLYQFHDGGSPLWAETQSTQLDSQGHYTVLLGAASAAGLPLDVFTNGAARWLGVQPALPGVGEQPRVLLVGVPYALKAADAETLGGKPASAYVTTEALGAPGSSVPASATSTKAGAQTPGPTTATPGPRKDASGNNPLITPCTTVTADGTATANQVAKFTAPCTIHQSQIFDNGTNVGIRTTSPGATLDISAPNQVGLFVRGPESGVGAGLDLQTTGAGGLQWEILDTGNTSAQGPNKLNIRNVNTGKDVLTITASGQAGIGTTVPGATLDVNGNTSVRGDLNLPQTFNSSAGVINMAGSPFIHACCSVGAFDTFVGSGAGNFTATGNVNTAVGHGVLGFDTTGSQNTGTGASALAFTNTGSGNTASGFSAFISNTTGNWNSAFGSHTNVSAGNLTNATAIGAFATVGESDAVVLGCTLGSCAGGALPPKVGIGTTTPFSTLDVVAPNQVGLFVRGPASGVGAGMHFQTTGTGLQEWEILDTGASSAQGANKLNIRNINTGNDIFTILSNGAVGIETVHPDNTLTVNGSADKPGGGSWGTFSDGRLKTVESTYDAGLDAILKLTPVRYRYNQDNAMGIKDDEEHVGFVAQEVEKVIPEAVSKNSQGYLLVNNDPILWTMLNAIKQQQAEIDALTRSVHEKDAQIEKLTEQVQASQRLQNQMVALEERLTQLEAKSGNSLAFAAINEVPPPR